MDKLEHDPRTKQQIKDALYEFLYGPVQKQFKNRLETLIMRNTVMGGYSHMHFTYKGEIYSSDNAPVPIRKNRLQTALRAEMDNYLADVAELNSEELPYVLGFINQVLNSSSALEDYKRILPDAIHQPLIQLQATCPYRETALANERIEYLMSKNIEPINMIKRRLVSNLLI